MIAKIREGLVSIISFALVFGNLLFVFGVQTKAQGSNFNSERNNSKARKVSRDLEEDLQNASYNNNETKRVLIELRDPIPSDNLGKGRIKDKVRQKMESLNGRMKGFHSNVGLVVADVPLSKIQELMLDEEIAYISADRKTKATGHVLKTTGAWSSGMWHATAGNTPGFEDMNVAILDSGINSHFILQRHNGDGNTIYSPGVVHNRNFTDELATSDKYGHGTHVAALASASEKLLRYDNVWLNFAYGGTARWAGALNLKVLKEDGSGNVSDVIAALDWVIANKDAHKIRVVNMSFGAPAIDSYRNDPLCLAARRVHDAGIVVVAAAGNDGKDTNGNKIYGRIHAPGNDPSVITVGASNSFGTETRSDDGITTFSSRGPTRSYYTDNSGVKHYDNLIKPDLVAPGNKIISASAGTAAKISRDHPSLMVDIPGNDFGNTQITYMSGTSMSAPQVSGAALMVLQANPKLTPSMVKAILMYSAQPLQGANTLEQGAGLLNVAGAVRIADAMKSSFRDRLGSTIMGSKNVPNPQTSTIEGETVYWGRGIITNHTFVTGTELITKWQGGYSQGKILADMTYISGNRFQSNLLSSGISIAKGPITNNGVLMGDGILFVDGVVMGDGVLMGDGVVMGDGVLMGDGVVMGDNGISPDTAIYGDNTSHMLPVLD